MNHFEQNLGYFNSPPNWMTLQPSEDLRCWAGIVESDMAIEKYSIMALVELIKGGRLGCQEGSRILAHLMKDSDSSWWRQRPSKWLYKSSHEAIDAIRNWQDWDSTDDDEATDMDISTFAQAISYKLTGLHIRI